jgi:predicted RNA-binding protein associated with RNAse of E/G family
VQYLNFPAAGKTAVVGKGMSWLEIVPDGGRHVVNAYYTPDNALSSCYIDIIEGIEYDPDGVAAFIDKYLDVIFTPQGDMAIDDRDELDAARASGELSQEQYDAALSECDYIMGFYCADLKKTEAYLDGLLAHVNGLIDSGLKKWGCDEI